MKKYLEAGIIRANSIGLWYFIIHLPTTPAIDGHIFFLHFVFSLINGVELMKMAQSGLVHTGEQHFHCIMCKLAVWASLCWWTFHPRGLCHIYDLSMMKGALLHVGLHHQLLSHTCMLHTLHATRCTHACCTLRGQPMQDMVWKPGSIISLPTGHLHKVMIDSESPHSAQCCCPQCGIAAASKLAEAFTSNLQHY